MNCRELMTLLSKHTPEYEVEVLTLRSEEGYICPKGNNYYRKYIPEYVADTHFSHKKVFIKCNLKKEVVE